jgi:hypothetical protein
MRPARILLACLTAGLAWIVVEVSGGLFFLALGVRLWRYEILPLWWEITSPIVWGFAVVFIVPLSLLFDRAVTSRFRGLRGWTVHCLFLMATGTLLEVVFNDLIFRHFFGGPLYTYLVLPTFHGSGSWLSPLYYATLLIHRPVSDRLLREAPTPPARLTGAPAVPR